MPGDDGVRFDPALCTQQADTPHGQTVGITGTNLMVTSAHYEASKAGCKILATGGTAIDAAVAVQAVLGTAEPFGSGLGGGALITYYDAASKRVRTFDGFSAAPGTAAGATSIYNAVAQDVSTVAPFNVCKTGLTVGASISAQQGNTNISARATGIPGAVAVLDLVHKAYGKAPWNTLWDDAIALADNGFPMTKYMYSTLYADSADFDDDGVPVNAGTGVSAWSNAAGTSKGAPRCKYPDIRKRYCDSADVTMQKPLPIGTLITNPDLAATMRLVRDGGAEAFYDPAKPIAQAIVQRTTAGSLPCRSILPMAGTAANPAIANTIASIPSLMEVSDFSNYRAVERQPLTATRFGLTVHTQPAPSFGGFVSLYALGLLERKQVQDQSLVSPRFVYTAAEASRLANVDRRAVVGDPAYSNVNARVATLLSDAELDVRAGQITGSALGTIPLGNIGTFIATDPANYDTLAAARSKPAALSSKTRLASLARPARDEDWNTTSHLSIVDGFGNALSMTTTINTHWGAHIEAAGMMLNNVMSNFSASAGSDVNGYAANKRPRSSIAPSIALDSQGQLRMVWGAAGGGPIPDYIVKTFMGHAVYGMDLQAAANAPNYTGQNGIAEVEAGSALAPLAGELRSTFGYTTSTLQVTGLKSGFSGIAVARSADGKPVYSGAADNRRSGAAFGY